VSSVANQRTALVTECYWHYTKEDCLVITVMYRCTTWLEYGVQG